jgi:hypothetical protein
VHHEDGPHTPLSQYAEQQSLFEPHALPSVLHDALSAAHVPLSHAPPQHWPSCVHAWPSLVHCVPEHVPPMQLTVQQSVFAPHAWPDAAHVVVLTLQAPVGSHVPEQHVESCVHGDPYTPHDGPLPPPVPLSVVAPCLLPHAARRIDIAIRAFIDVLL